MSTHVITTLAGTEDGRDGLDAAEMPVIMIFAGINPFDNKVHLVLMHGVEAQENRRWRLKACV